MGPFEAFKFSWDGKDYAIPAAEQTKIIAEIEEIVTAYELAGFVAKHGGAPTGKLAMAFGIMLRKAGLSITDNEVRHGLFGNKATEQQTLTATMALINFLDPSMIGAAEEGGELNPPQGEPAGAASSSRKSTKRRSATTG